MSTQKANPNSSHFDNLNPYHPNDPSGWIYPIRTDAQATAIYRPLPAFQYTKVYSSGNLPAASASSGFIVYVIDNPTESRQLYSDGSTWQILLQ
jgi:hypothetical protein